MFAPATVTLIPGLENPENPVIAAVEFKVKVLLELVLVKVKVPLPDKVPLSVRLPVPVVLPSATVGLLPRGKLQPLFTTVVPLFCTLANTILLKVTLLHVRFCVTFPAPVKVIVPALALKVGDPEMAIFPEIFIFPDVEVNVPAVNVKPALVIVWLVPSKVPSACEYPPVIINARETVIVLVYPEAIVRLATVP